MQDKKTILIIDEPSSNVGKLIGSHCLGNHLYDLTYVIENTLPQAFESESFIITRPPDMPLPFIDRKLIPNYHKHRQTCDKNRKARKNKK